MKTQTRYFQVEDERSIKATGLETIQEAKAIAREMKRTSHRVRPVRITSYIPHTAEGYRTEERL